MQLVQRVAKKFPASKRFLEYEDYDRFPTKENAAEYLNAVAERYADRVDELKTLVRYISERPGVEHMGSHGLFSQLDVPIDIDEVADRIANHDGIVWNEVISLRREDAERLHYNNAAAWRDLVRRNMNEIALAHRIKVDDLRWYGAFHNTTHHPHIHFIHRVDVYEKPTKYSRTEGNPVMIYYKYQLTPQENAKIIVGEGFPIPEEVESSEESDIPISA